MKKQLFFLFTLLLSIGNLSLKADDITFQASTPDTVIVGEHFRLTYKVNAEGKELRAPDMSDFEILVGPLKSTSRSIQTINGQSSGTLTEMHSYLLSAKREGSFKLAPAIIKVNDEDYSSNYLVIKVLQDDEMGSSHSEKGDKTSKATNSSSNIGNLRKSVSCREQQIL